MYVYIHIWSAWALSYAMCICVYVYSYIDAYMHISSNLNTCRHVHIHTCIHTYIHTDQSA